MMEEALTCSVLVKHLRYVFFYQSAFKFEMKRVSKMINIKITGPNQWNNRCHVKESNLMIGYIDKY